MKVLIADNDSDTRNFLMTHLQTWGYEIVEARNGQKAWEALWADDPPRIAFLDWAMSEMGGLEICERLHQNKNLPFVYTVLMGTEDELEEMSKSLTGRSDDFLLKPIRAFELKARATVGTRMARSEDKLHIYAGELRKYLTEIKQLGIADYLTGVYNRRYFLERAVMELERSKRYNRRFSILIIDIDHFKQLNDQYGHLAGDEALQTLTRETESMLRKSDLLARFGGEEFSVLLPETGVKGAAGLAERIRRTIEDISVDFDEMSFGFTISIGGTEVTEHDDAMEPVLARADDALLRAKNNGRNRVDVG